MSINSKFFSLDYLEDYSRRLEQIAMWQRLKFYYDTSPSTTLDPYESVVWLTISGPGKGVYMFHKSQGISSWYAYQSVSLDGSSWIHWWPFSASVNTSKVGGSTSIGFYSFGVGGYIITLWDETNKKYEVNATFSTQQWLEECKIRFLNNQGTDTATMAGRFGYYLPTASKSFRLELIAPKMPKTEHLNEIRNEFKLHHIVMCLSKQGKGKGAKNQYKLTINAPDSFRDKNLYKVVEKIQKATK